MRLSCTTLDGTLLTIGLGKNSSCSKITITGVYEPAAVDYPLRNHPEWRGTYHLFEHHWAAMTIAARDLSDACGLAV